MALAPHWENTPEGQAHKAAAEVADATVADRVAATVAAHNAAGRVGERVDETPLVDYTFAAQLRHVGHE